MASSGGRAESPIELLTKLPEEPPSAALGRVFPVVGEELFEALRAAGHRKIVLQVPAGLVRDAHLLAATLRERSGSSVIVLNRACFGACDLPSKDEVLGADAAVVLGHSPIPNVRLSMPTYFVEMRHPGGDVARLARTVYSAGLPKRLGLVASVQHLDLVEPFRNALRELGIELRIGPGDRRLSYPAQALGCNYTTAESVSKDVEGFLFLGTGAFHPRGLALAVDRPVWTIDPLQGTLEPPIDRARLVRDRQLLVARTYDAKRWGILVSSFVGQDRSPMALALQARARSHGREAEILVFTRLDPNDLVGRDLDAFVNTACPRIALDDAENYPKPMLTPPEFLMALGELPLEPYRFDTYR